MAKLISITETAEAITAEAMAYVWEEYDAPRKRVKRARIVEHHFTVSIPKYDEDAAPLAFVIEHPGAEDATPWDEPIRYAAGRLYTEGYRVTHPRYCDNYSTDPRVELERAIVGLGVPDYTANDYAEAIARDEVRADQWHQYSGETAERVDEDAAARVRDLAVIGGEIWTETSEPVYEYHSPWRTYGGKQWPATIGVRTEDTANPWRNIYGAQDIALDFYHADVEHIADIRVIMPELVTVDSTARDLAQDCERTARNLEDARETLASLEEQLERARVDVEAKEAEEAKARAKREQYAADPREYWRERMERYGKSPFVSTRRAGERIAAALEA